MLVKSIQYAGNPRLLKAFQLINGCLNFEAMRLILLTALMMLLAAPTSYACSAGGGVWKNDCPNKTASEYCANVGKIAHNAVGPAVMRSVKLGKIIGVVWRPKGSLRNHPGGQYSTPARTSPRDAFYYIIDDGEGTECAFLRQAREISAK